MNKPFHHALRLTALACLLASAASHAAIVSHASRAAWNAAVGGAATVETLNSIGSDVTFTDSSTSVGALTFTSVGGAAGAMLIDVPPGAFSGGTGIDGTAYLSAGGLLPSSVLTITIGGPAVYAFAFDTMNYDFGGERAEVFIDGVSIGFTPGGATAGAPTFGFIGITSDTAFSAVTIRGAAGTFDVAAGFDNISWASAAVSTPGAASLAGLGLLALALTRRRG
jgi:hypothetical protein